MKIQKLFKLGFFVLIVLNAVLIFLLVSGPPHPKGPPNRPANGNSQIQIIGDKLNLSVDQMTQYREMAKQHRETMKTLQQEQKSLAQSYFELLKMPNDAEVKEQLISQLLDIERNKLSYTYTHFEALKSILSKEQTEQFDNIVDEIVRVLLDNEKKMPPPPRD